MPGINKQQANKWLQEFNCQYLLVGYKPDGYRGIPPTFETVTIPANSPDDVFNYMKGLSEVRVFEIMQSQYDDSWWRGMAIDQAIK